MVNGNKRHFYQDARREGEEKTVVARKTTAAKQNTTLLMYIIVGLMISTGVIYFIVASQELPLPSSKDDRISSEVQLIFFVVCGIAYIPIGIWMLVDAYRTKSAKNRRTATTIPITPYLIAIGGSAALIVLYILSRIISLPLVELQTDVGTIDVLAKVVQAGIIAGSVIMVASIRKKREKQQEKEKLL